MGDIARQQLSVDIERAERTEKMLLHLAAVVAERPRPPRERASYPNDATDALEHGAQLAASHAANLRHVAEVYDTKVLLSG